MNHPQSGFRDSIGAQTATRSQVTRDPAACRNGGRILLRSFLLDALALLMVTLLACAPLPSQTRNVPAAATPRVPRGLYSNFLLEGLVTNAQNLAGASSSEPGLLTLRPWPTATLAPQDAAIVNYLTTLLDNPAISGLAPQIPWYLLNPNSPGPDPSSPAPGAYNWNPLNDVFIAVDQWNAAHPAEPAKTIQIILSAGFNSPGWVFSDIDATVCGTGVVETGCTGSCDGLFMTPSPILPVSGKCGYTTLFYRTESNPVQQMRLPMPWNAKYKSDWKAYLTALNKQIQTEPSSNAFVSITMAGPTASSAEMILPNQGNQGPYESGGVLRLKSGKGGVVPPGETAIGVDVPTAWNMLIEWFHGSSPTYHNTDLPFVQAWNTTIDNFGDIFSGVTLILTTTTDALPNFPGGAPSLLVPADGFNDDCDDPPTSTAAMPCAAVTQVLAHLTNPIIGGKSAKAVFEAGMTASRNGVDLGENGVKWLGFDTAAGTTPLPGTNYDMSRILGGIQFAQTFSPAATIQAEGCPTYPKTLCAGLTPSVALHNVLGLRYFDGTVAGPVWGSSESVVQGDFQYYDAPMNFLEIYSTDIVYASGLAGCSFKEIAGDPAKGTPPDTSTCAVQPSSASFLDVQTTQEELELTNLLLDDIAEPSALP
jgi:hypothetical protein